ncbi:murein hydrolase activator EnvC family protein [Neomoorella humiferrea]|uniref:Stage II sporulation protein Q n=1 Tax=Neomoorella humiferrea TaxID=676965 RepID=A0A2T0AW66_9FIRM|nr:M23 family metallopeptidase [Moorella humiferrea]PRR74979.1 Stage II sporulation protein Q [Moorella humiferrea]
MRDNWDWEEVKGAPLGGCKGPGRTLPPAKRRSRLLRQGIAAGLIWLAVTLLFRLDDPWARPLKTGLRHYLADPAADFTPVLAQAVRSTMWLDAYDRWVFHFLRQEGNAVSATAGATSPAMAVPLAGNIVQKYGPVVIEGRQYFHNGIDIQAAGGAEVRAALAGKVIRTGPDPVLGLVVELDHGGGMVTLYGTLGQVKVTPGQAVEKGEVIAVLAPDPAARLHFEVRRDGRPVDPEALLNFPSQI